MKKLLRVYQSSRTHWVGDGFPVRSVFDYNGLGKDLSPFLLLDYVAPYLFAPTHERRGVGAHPHKGFETVTVAFQGEIEHRDSSGGGGKIGPGDVQWMTAGNGIVHEEFQSDEFSRKGGTFQMAQLWVIFARRTRPRSRAIKTCSKRIFQLSRCRKGQELSGSSRANIVEVKVRQKLSHQSICGM